MSKQITGGVVDTHTGIFTAGTICCQRFTGKAALTAGNSSTNNIYDYGTYTKTVLYTDISTAAAYLFKPNVPTNVVFNITTTGAETATFTFRVTGVDQFNNTVSEDIVVTGGSTTTSGNAGVIAFKKLIGITITLSAAFGANVSHVYMGYGSKIGLLRTITDKYDVISWMNGTTEVTRALMTANVSALTLHPTLNANTITSTTALAASTNVIYYYTTDREHHNIK